MDGQGLVRVRRSEAEWRQIVERFSGSGISVRQFCQEEGLSEKLLWKWRKRFEGRRKEAARFIEIPQTFDHDYRAELDLGGIVLRIFR